MRKLLTGATLVLVLGAAGTAAAGGWATAGLPAPPAGTKAGDVWLAEITLLQHGRTPLAGVMPTLTIENRDTGRTETFTAEPTGERGVYVARVVFPEAGTWSYEVWDDFSRTHTFAPVEVVGVAGGGGGGFPVWPVVGGVLAALAGIGLAAFVRARRESLVRGRTAGA